MIQQTSKIVETVRDMLWAAQNCDKSNAYRRSKPLEFHIDDLVLLKVSPMKGIYGFGRKGKFSLGFIGLFRILERVGCVCYHF